MMFLNEVALKYHKERMAKIDKMSGTNKPPKFAYCGRHFFIMILNNDQRNLFGKPLRWKGKGQAPWGKAVTKADLLIGNGVRHQAAVAAAVATAATGSIVPTTVIMPIGAAASAPTIAWSAPAATLAVVNSTMGNTAAQQAGAPEPAPAPASAPAASNTDGQSNAAMMDILLALKEQIASNDARQEFVNSW